MEVGDIISLDILDYRVYEVNQVDCLSRSLKIATLGLLDELVHYLLSVTMVDAREDDKIVYQPFVAQLVIFESPIENSVEKSLQLLK